MNDLEGTRLNLLIFSVGGVCFGCDAEQVEGMSALGSDVGDDLFWFHKELEYGDAPRGYHAPTIITIKTGYDRTYRVIIDMMEDLVEIFAEEIEPFPYLMEPFVLRKGMWGVVAREGRMVLLMDFQRFLREKWGPTAHDGGND